MPASLPLSVLVAAASCILLLETAAAAAGQSNGGKNRTQAIDNHQRENELLMWSIKLTTDDRHHHQHHDDTAEDDPDGATADKKVLLDATAQSLALRAGLVSWGQVGQLRGVYSLAYCPSCGPLGLQHRPTLTELHKQHRGLAGSFAARVKQRAEAMFDASIEVLWYSQEIVRSRHPRGLLDTCNDPFAAYQWHLKAKSPQDFDVNVTGVWDEGNFGRGVTVCLLDDGLDYGNPDLKEAYNAKGSYDFNDNDYDPMPTDRSPANHHGTRCAGEIAAKPNNYFCGLGIATASRVSMLKILDGTVTDGMEGMAYNYQYHGNYIYSSSWGPPDTGNYIDGPHLLGRQALRNGVRFGRHGYGSIFVVASGNGGRFADNCNFDGYATSEFTVTIGAVTKEAAMPAYAEECACIHGVTVSSGADVGIVTTDWRLLTGTGCTSGHGGTSAAAPLAAGMIALMLSVRPCLGWRDVQHILVLTAEKVDRQIGHYVRNGAGLFHSHRHGFGMLSAWRLVQVAKVWDSVPPAQYEDSGRLPEYSHIPAKSTAYLLYDNTDAKQGTANTMLEHVKIQLSIDHPSRGQLVIVLYSPAGTSSVLATLRPHDKSTAGLRWTFATVRSWGESPLGEWKLAINNTSDRPGTVNSWRLIFVLTAIKPKDYQARIRRVRDIVTGRTPASAKAKACPRMSPTFTADGEPPSSSGISSAGSRFLQMMRRLPVLFNFLLIASLCGLVYYTVYTSATWCRDKYKCRQEARTRRGATPYDYYGPLPCTSSSGAAGISAGQPPRPPPPGLDELPPSYEEAVSESTSLLARYDARSSSVTFPASGRG